jgi:antirestriction protein ArdC
MTKADQASRGDVHARITAKIVAALEQGVLPWHRPWNAHGDGPVLRPLRHNGVPYQGINIIMLWAAAAAAGYQSPYWLTFRQARELGGNVRKGEHGELVVYANRIARREVDEESGEETERSIPFLKGYIVFNSEQCENLPVKFAAISETPVLPALRRCEAADNFFSALGADIRHGGSRAFYSETYDFIQMPPFASFDTAESYAATLAHECVHWTKHSGRLARDMGRVRHGDEGYAREELVAELGAAFLCADLGITPEVREDHASYIASWLEVLKNDKRFVFSAASHAQRAVDYLHGLQRTAGPAAA